MSEKMIDTWDEHAKKRGSEAPANSDFGLAGDYVVERPYVSNERIDPSAPTKSAEALADKMLGDLAGAEVISDWEVGKNVSLDNDPNAISPEQAEVVEEIFNSEPEVNAMRVGAESRLSKVSTDVSKATLEGTANEKSFFKRFFG